MINFGIKKMPHSKPKNKVGLDIGSYAIKMIEVTSATDKTILVAFGLKKVVDASTQSLANSIKILAEESKILTREVNISVSGSSVIVRFISMPKMSDEDLRGAIKFEAEKFIPFNIDDCVVDFQILKRNERENKLDILLAAAKKGYIEDRIKMVEDAGFSVNLVDVDSFALVNSFTKNFPNPEQDKTLALLNIGATLTNLSIVRGGAICFARDMAIGGSDFNNAISRGLNIDIGSTEEMKLHPKEKLEEMTACTKGVLNNLLDEARLSFSYYENQCGRNIDEIYISGGSAALAGLAGFFEEAFGSKPKQWDPFQFLDTSSSGADSDILSNMKSSFAVAAGLVLR